jgi:hypothetical protein
MEDFMSYTATQLNRSQGPGCLGPARVLEVDEEEGLIQVVVHAPADGQGGSRKSWATPALPYDGELGWGDTVLVAGEPNSALYVVGVLKAQTRGKVRGKELVLQSGARAEADGPADAERLKVFAADGELIFEHDPASGKSRIGVPSGDLEIVTRNGNIDFISAEGVRFFSKSAIEMKSLEGIQLAASNARQKTLTALNLQPGRVDLRSAELGIWARKGELRVDEAEIQGEKLFGAIASVKLTMKRCETLVGTVIEKAKTAYRTVEELTQLKTGRLRTLVDGVYQLQSQTALLKAKEDFKVDGEQIHLG